MEHCVGLMEESGEAAVEQLRVPMRGLTVVRALGRGNWAQLWSSEACEESPGWISACLGGQQGRDQHQSPSNPEALETMDVCVQLQKNLHLTT